MVLFSMLDLLTHINTHQCVTIACSAQQSPAQTCVAQEQQEPHSLVRTGCPTQAVKGHSDVWITESPNDVIKQYMTVINDHNQKLFKFIPMMLFPLKVISV